MVEAKAAVRVEAEYAGLLDALIVVERCGPGVLDMETEESMIFECDGSAASAVERESGGLCQCKEWEEAEEASESWPSREGSESGMEGCESWLLDVLLGMLYGSKWVVAKTPSNAAELRLEEQVVAVE